MTSLLDCPACGKEVPAGMPSCGWCGAALTETGQREPVNVQGVDRRLFGVPPATLLLASGAFLVGVGVVLLATGNLLLGAIALTAGLLLLAAFPAVARRPDESAVARRAVRSYDAVRERASSTVDSLVARAAARRAVARIDQDLEQLERSRVDALRRLGEAAYAEDEAAVERVRAEIAAADSAQEAKQAERERVRSETDERVGQAHLRAQPTERLDRDEIAAESERPD